MRRKIIIEGRFKIEAFAENDIDVLETIQIVSNNKDVIISENKDLKIAATFIESVSSVYGSVPEASNDREVCEQTNRKDQAI